MAASESKKRAAETEIEAAETEIEAAKRQLTDIDGKLAEVDRKIRVKMEYNDQSDELLKNPDRSMKLIRQVAELSLESEK